MSVIPSPESTNYAAAQLAALIESTRDLIWTVDLEYRLTSFNQAYADHILKNFGNRAKAGMGPGELLTPETAANWPPMYARALREGSHHTEYELPDGRWLELSLNPILQEGKPAGFSIFGKDITDRRKAMVALEQRETMLNQMGEMAKVGGWELEPESRCLTWTEEVFRIHEVDASFTPTLEGAIRFYTEDSRPVIASAVGRALEHGEPFDIELTILSAKGNRKDVHAIGRIAVRSDGKRVLSGTFQDITEVKQSEEKLRQSEEQYRATFSQAAVGILHTSFDGRILRCNPRFAEFIGYPLEEVLGMNFREITLPEDLSNSEKILKQIARGDQAFAQWEKRYIRKDGSCSWGRITLSPQKDAEGRPMHLISVVEDINAQKGAEEALRKAEQKFRQIFDDAPEGIFQTSKEGRSLALNPAAAKLLGFVSAEAGTRQIQDSANEVWLHPEDRTRYTELLERQGEIRDFICQFKNTDGTPRWVSLTARKICGADGQTLYYQGFMQNITERMRLEDTLKANVRELQLLSEINSALLHANTEEELLAEYCRIVVEVGGYHMAWVGFAEDAPEKRILPVAHFGHDDGYLAIVNLTWDESERGQGPTGTAMRTGVVQCTREISSDPRLMPWHAEAAKRGYRSSIALPFRHSNGQMACLTTYGEVASDWTESEQKLMNQIAQDLGFGIKTLRTEIAKNKYQQELRASLLEMIQVIAETVDQRDPYTAGHQHRVADLCFQIAAKLGLSEERTLGLKLAANIHDLGKIGIPAELLTKPGRLSVAQLNLIKEHAQLGYDIVKNVHFPWPIADIIHQHHERLDGSGYPLGLKEPDILLESKILAVADVVEAMGTQRPYRAALGLEVALDEILARRDTLFDREVVNVCVALFREEGYQFPA